MPIKKLTERMQGISPIEVLLMIQIVIKLIKLLLLLRVSNDEAIDILHNPGLVAYLLVRYEIRKSIHGRERQRELEKSFWDACKTVTSEELTLLFSEVR